jgi:MFS family permease
MTASSAVIILLLCVFPSLPAAFLAYSAFGTVIAFFWPPLMGWLSRGLEGRDLSRATGLFSFSWSVGGIVSPYLAGILSERGKFLPLWFAVAMFAANAVFLQASRRLLRDSDERPVPDRARSAPARDGSTPLRFSAWTSVTVLYAAIGILANIFPLFARGELGLSESRTGLLITVRAAAMTGGFLFFGRTSFWRFRRGLLMIPTLLAGVAALVLALAADFLPVLAAGLGVFGFASAWAYNGSMFYGASGAPDRDRRMTVHEALLTAGQVFGSFLGGILYQASSMRLVFLFIAIMAGAGVWTQSWMARRRFGEAPAHRPPLGMD